MGLKEYIHQLSWILTAFVVFLWISISTTSLTTMSFLPKSNKIIVFVFFFWFAMSEVSLCFLISVFFSNSKIASICGPVILIFCLLPKFVFFGTNNNESIEMKVIASFLSPVGKWGKCVSNYVKTNKYSVHINDS
jgi:hypothetical protein